MDKTAAVQNFPVFAWNSSALQVCICRVTVFGSDSCFKNRLCAAVWLPAAGWNQPVKHLPLQLEGGCMYSKLFSMRIFKLCQKYHIKTEDLESKNEEGALALRELLSGKYEDPDIQLLHKAAGVFGMTLAEFLDFPEMNEYLPD